MTRASVMKAFVLRSLSDLSANREPLCPEERPRPTPGPGQILVRVSACGVCHTEIDEIEGRVKVKMPVIPGHQVIGRVEQVGRDCSRFHLGDRVGVAWIFSACGTCHFCREGLENLCPDFQGTGRDADGGYAEFMVAPEKFAVPVPDHFTDLHAAPLLCAGAVGYRALHLSGIQNGDHCGLTGFGGCAHLILKTLRRIQPESSVYVFARSRKQRDFAMACGAVWSGTLDEDAPAKLRAVIDTTPAWQPILTGLRNLMPGGRLVINAIGKEAGDLASLQRLDYQSHLWMEKEIKTVANVSTSDVRTFLRIAAKIDLIPDIEIYPFESANQALYDLKNRSTNGAKVLQIS